MGNSIVYILGYLWTTDLRVQQTIHYSFKALAVSFDDEMHCSSTKFSFFFFIVLRPDQFERLSYLHGSDTKFPELCDEAIHCTVKHKLIHE